jgi:hypothetical protein
MPISPERIQEFMRLYKEVYKEEITEDIAREMASRLVELYVMLAQPLPGDDLGNSGK